MREMQRRMCVFRCGLHLCSVAVVISWPNLEYDSEFQLKLPSIKFHGNPFSRSSVFTCVQTDGLTGSASQVCELA
jgi:hypothetical protein